jgi:hypothetical protein
VLQAEVEMLRRVAILLLVTLVAGVGMTACPRPATACTMAVQARHACCDHVALRTSQCCCSAGQRTTQLLSPMGPYQPDHGSRLLAAVYGWQPDMATGVPLTAQQRMRAGHGPAPPDTPIHNHTQLLL